MDDAQGRTARRQANLTRLQGTFPLPILIDDLALPDGGHLDEDEFVVRVGKDWGVSLKPMMLTTRRLICPRDPSGRDAALIPLDKVSAVAVRKHWVGSGSIVVDWAAGRAFFPVYLNPARVRDEIAAMVAAAQPAMPEAPAAQVPEGDRLEKLRRVGELRASGVLTDKEFEQEKARILREP
ncbi:MAG: SHOCT domain-containing protein [Candidatus Dormibacteraeota bacterium]|nr:SHOCT domain-containing protein [Candidatus Dormibacteraeota bacterium]